MDLLYHAVNVRQCDTELRSPWTCCTVSMRQVGTVVHGLSFSDYHCGERPQTGGVQIHH